MQNPVYPSAFFIPILKMMAAAKEDHTILQINVTWFPVLAEA